MPIEPEMAPDLTGTYDLVSLQYPGQPLLTPPNTTGTFTVRQTSEGEEAGGTFDMDVRIMDPPITIADNGTYKNRADGTWEQSGESLQTRGTYTVAGDSLTVDVVEPDLAVSTTVWTRR